MSVYDRVQKFCADKNTIQPAKQLGYGFHGEVFDVAGCSDKVVKYSYVTETMCISRGTLDNFYKNVEAALAYQHQHDYPCFVRVVSYNHLYTGESDYHPDDRLIPRRSRMQKFILYSVVMEKLFPLSDDEKKLFTTICEAVYDGKNSSLKGLVKDQANWLEFSTAKVYFFISKLERSPIVQKDFQRHNIMKDVNGNFKIIDFDFAELKENKS